MRNLLIISFLLLLELNGYGQEKDSPPNDSLNFTLQGTAYCFELKKPIKGAEVKIIGTDGSSKEAKTDSLGIFTVNLEPNTSYSIIVSAEKHINARSKQTTVAHTKSKVFYPKYELKYSSCCFTPLPSVSYKHNKAIPINKNDDSTNVAAMCYILKSNPNLVIEIIGYRHKSENKSVSYKRAKKFAKSVINFGIDRDRIVINNGGIRPIKTEIVDPHLKVNPPKIIPERDRLALAKIIATDYKPK